MKMIKQIFLSDIKALFGNAFVLIIALGLCALPALYAWFNIYSNWDPYGNTGNLRVAVASYDKGYTDRAGKTVNAGEDVVRSLKKNKSLCWVFTSPSSAKKKVDSGDCYAAIILPEDFSRNMYDGFRKGLKRPRIDYLINEKKNAVANKITDTAVSNLENNLNEMYISIVVSNMFTREAQIAGDIKEAQLVGSLQDRIAQASDTISGYENTLKVLQDANKKLSGTLDEATLDVDNMKKKAEELAGRSSEDSSYLLHVRERNRHTSRYLSDASLDIERASVSASISKSKIWNQKAVEKLEKAKQEIDKLIAYLRKASVSQEIAKRNEALISKLKAQKSEIDALKKRLNSAADSKKQGISAEAEALISKKISSLLDTQQSVVVPLSEELAGMVDAMERDVKNALKHIAQDADLLREIITGTDAALQSANGGVQSLSETFHLVTKKLGAIHDSLGSLSDSELVNKVSAFLQEDPEGYGAFFASPVQIKSERVYPVANYGSGVTPFYTTLAIWVGGIFLVSLIKVKPDHEKFSDAKPHELFLGRYLLFFLLGQLQAVIIVFGNLSLLHVQCLSPQYFWLASAFAAFTFSLLIYTLTVSFGDLGKACIVVIVVLQIAGSSGTFPIEILPVFYQKIHVFFPFPYAINAMREAVCGMNGNDYAIYILKLLLFGAAALFIGLVLRLPFRKLSHFVESRMEDTEMM